jgi:hypothetical protein
MSPLALHRPLKSVLAVLLGCTLAGACRTVHTTPPRPVPAACAGACGDTLSVRFLGVAGWVIRHRDDAVLTAPLFTTAGLFTVMAGGAIRSDAKRVRDGMDSLDLHGVSAILVGHAHYDHLLDVPLVAKEFATRAAVYGNRSMVNQLHADPVLRPRLVPVEDSAATGEGGGRWIYPKTDTLFRGARPVTAEDSSVRILPVVAAHPPHFLKLVHMFAGESEMRVDAPRTAYDWREGQVHAFVVEFLDVKRHAVLFRVHYSDAPSWPGAGIPPRWVGEPGSYDLALTSVGSYDQVWGRTIPFEFVEAVRPRHVAAGHWENFFGHDGQPRTQPLENVAEYKRRLDCAMHDTAAVTLPRPGDTIQVCGCAPRPMASPLPAPR